MEYMEFKHPAFLWLLVPFFALAGWYLYARVFSRESAVALSSEHVITNRRTVRARTYRWLPLLRFAAVFLLIVGLSRPGRGVDYTSIKNQGIDIMIALDASGSMMGEDFQPENRLEVAKRVMKDFIARRKGDRIGMVVFAGEAYLQCPLVADHQILLEILEDIDFESVPVNGTAIGDALALSASRMIDGKGKGRMILLLTDGMNNKGVIDPETAARAAAENGIRVYTVGIGREGRVPYPARGPAAFLFGSDYRINEFDGAALEKIAGLTGGKYFRATSSGVLWENVREIDRLEKSETELKVYHEFHEKFAPYLIAGISIFFLEILLRSIVYRKVP